MTLPALHCDAHDLAYQFHSACTELEQALQFARSLSERDGLQFLQLWRSGQWDEIQRLFPDFPTFPSLEEESF
jgi:hypothetical protein